VLALGWSWAGLGLALAMYFLRMFGITAGYHRYFSHRSFKTSRVGQFVLALLGTLAAQKGVLWWAAHHRHHHKYSDQPDDVHSPRQRGFFWSHVGWILSRKHQVLHWDRVKDLARYPELRFLQRFELLITVGFATLLYVVAGGFWGLLWGFFVSTTLLWHGTFTINSFAHIIGRRRYDTTDDSRNSFLLALITMGEGWHNNHHYYQRATAQGFYWWEIDVSYYVLLAMSWLGLVWDVSKPPRAVRDPRGKGDVPHVPTPAIHAKVPGWEAEEGSQVCP
jgi:stearoyl-CoA desaturase (delta-9 desaturase)